MPPKKQTNKQTNKQTSERETERKESNREKENPHSPIFKRRVVGVPKMTSHPFLHFSPLSTVLLDLAKSKPGPFPHVVFPPPFFFFSSSSSSFSWSALSSSAFYCALQNSFGVTWWTGDMSIPLQFASLYVGQEVFMWSDCLLDLGTDFLVANMVMYEMRGILR